MTQNTQDPSFVSTVKFNSDGLVPAIAQQYNTGEVLMMAWMNADSIAETLNSGRAVYWSRSRQAYWRKGDTSGHEQHIKEVRVDCDGDTVLLIVDQVGAACHTGARTCFYQAATDTGSVVETTDAYVPHA